MCEISLKKGVISKYKVSDHIKQFFLLRNRA